MTAMPVAQRMTADEFFALPEREGLPELWLVDAAADTVLVFRRSRPDAPKFDVSDELTRGDALTSPLLPGFALALDELFGD